MKTGAVAILLLITHPLFSQYKYGSSLGDSTVFAVNSKNNYLYAGIDNIIRVNLDQPAEKYLLTTSNGLIFYDSIQYITIPERAGKARIIVSKVDGNDTSIIGYNFFTVKNIPDPQLKIDTVCFSERDTINKILLLTADTLNIFITPDIIGSEKWFKITGYSIGYVYGGFYKSYNCTGNTISNEIKYMINQIGPGKDIVIKVFTRSSEGIKKELPIYRLLLN